MANRLRDRRQSETSKILSNLADKKAAINISNNEAVNQVLNNNFVNQTKLANARGIRIENIRQLNEDYIRATQDVLDDQTLDFLVQHSRIDAPTLTSAFAGFELAKAAQAKRLNQQREFDIQTIQARQEAGERVQAIRDAQTQSQISQIQEERGEAVEQAEFEARETLRAVAGDIAADESAEARAEQQAAVDARVQAQIQASLEEERIKASSRNQEALALQELRDLANPPLDAEVTTTTTITTDTIEVPEPTAQATLISDIERNAVLSEALTEEELFNVNAERERANLTDVPLLPVTEPEQLTDAEVISIAQTRGIDIQPQNQTVVQEETTTIESPVVIIAKSDEQIVLSPEVLQQINTLNQTREDVEINPLELQQQLQEGDIDPAGLTVEELNDLFRL